MIEQNSGYVVRKSDGKAHYKICGLGYMLWAPGADRAEFWFGSQKQVREFAMKNGWRLKEE